MEFDRFLERLTNLRLDKARGPVKPYKPILVASVLMLIEKGKITDGRVWLDGALKSVFEQLMHAVYPDWQYDWDIKLPFRHLENDGVWTLQATAGDEDQLEIAKAVSKKAPALLKNVAFAKIDDDVFDVLQQSFERRRAALNAIIDTYLPEGARTAIGEVLSDELPDPPMVRESRTTERMIEEYLFSNWADTPFASMGVQLSTRGECGLPGRQVMTPVNSIDLLGYQAAAKEWWVFELKKGKPGDSVVGQVSRYLGWIDGSRGPEGQSAHGVILAEGAGEKLRYAVGAHRNRLQLWTYDSSLEFERVV